MRSLTSPVNLRITLSKKQNKWRCRVFLGSGCLWSCTGRKWCFMTCFTNSCGSDVHLDPVPKEPEYPLLHKGIVMLPLPLESEDGVVRRLFCLRHTLWVFSSLYHSEDLTLELKWSLADRNSFEVITIRFLCACVSMAVYVCSCVHRSEVSFGYLSSGTIRLDFWEQGSHWDLGLAHQLIKVGFSTGCWGSNSGFPSGDISPAWKYLSLKLEVCAG